jgi:branched-chain amino acid transport system ATP-binding protein
MSRRLELRGVSRHFGAVKAVNDVSLVVEPGARHGLIGPNGAGKSTLFSLIAGQQPVTAGSIIFDGRDITKASMPARAKLGIQQTFQHARLFLPQTVQENVALAARRSKGVQGALWRPASSYKQVTARALECLSLVGLEDRAGTVTGNLSHGERRQLEVAILLAGDPEVILLDEPTAGMSPAETAAFVSLVQGLPDDLSIVVVEHDLEVVFSIASHVSVLNLGELIASGSPQQVRHDALVQAAYLGGADAQDVFDTSPRESA